MYKLLHFYERNEEHAFIGKLTYHKSIMDEKFFLN